MGSQHITTHSPASQGVMQLISQTPGITAAEISKRGGWSVYHVRNVLRYLRMHGKVKSVRPHSFKGECCWWIGRQEQTVIAPVPRMPLKLTAPNSVFALGAA